MSNKLLLITLPLFVATPSCENHIYLDDFAPEKLLTLQGNLMAEDSLHTIYLCMSYVSEFRPVSSAKLSCYVNGNLVGGSSEVRSYKDWPESKISEMSFKAVFHAGDEVRIEVEADGQRASVTGIVPQPASIERVDTTMVERLADDGMTQKMTRYDIRISDRVGEKNKYRIMLLYRGRLWVKWAADGNEEGYVTGQTIGYANEIIGADNSLDPMLHKDISIGDTGNNSSNYTNDLNIFSDDSFSDRGCSITLLSQLIRYYRGTYEYSYVSNTATLAEDRQVRVRLISMTSHTYTYMSNWQYDNSDLADWSMSTSIPYPDNVDGGIGYVAFSMPVDYVIELPEAEIF